jgi:hypothetical protein
MAENTIKGAKTLATARSLTIARLLANKLSAEKPSNNAGHHKFLLRAILSGCKTSTRYTPYRLPAFVTKWPR